MNSRPRLPALEELRAIVDLLKTLPETEKQILAEFRGDPEKLKAILAPPFHWAQIYEYPLVTHIAVLNKIEDSPDAVPTSPTAFRELRDADANTSPDTQSSDANIRDPKLYLVTWYALTKSLKGIILLGTAINDLVAAVRAGNDLALFQAVRLDRCTLAARPIADRIAWAELNGDTKFFNQLSNAINHPIRKPHVDYGPLRYLLYLLDETGELGKLSEEDRYDLFCLKLGVYPTSGEDPARALSRFIQRWKKD